MIPMKGGRSMTDYCPGTGISRRAWLLAAVAVCTIATSLPSAVCAAGSDGGSDAAVVSLSLSKYGNVQTIGAGTTAGVRPGILTVHVGDRVVFVNDDTDHHTATSLVGAGAFVDDPRWTDDALHAVGEIGPGFWSTGDLAPGQRSAPLVAKRPGTYLYGCFFDYGAGMRGEIVVEP
jgi:plastocyanin